MGWPTTSSLSTPTSLTCYLQTSMPSPWSKSARCEAERKKRVRAIGVGGWAETAVLNVINPLRMKAKAQGSARRMSSFLVLIGRGVVVNRNNDSFYRSNGSVRPIIAELYLSHSKAASLIFRFPICVESLYTVTSYLEITSAWCGRAFPVDDKYQAARA